MEIQMEIPKIIEETIHPNEQQQPLDSQQPHIQTPYRWVVLSLTGLSLLLNGLAHNSIIPLEHKMTVIYSVSETKVTLAVILSFLVFLASNFPANKIMDKKGLRHSLLINNALYFGGTLFYTLINKSFNFVILGTVFLGLGQPFLVNSPAKLAAFWFFPKNRAFATAILVAINLLGMGLGFLIPTLVVGEDMIGEEAEQKIGHLYLAYFIFSGVCLILSLLFMRGKPQTPPSEGATAQKNSSIRESFYKIKNDKNLWKFFGGYCLGYGTMATFAANSNFIIKPYHYTDLEISINAVLLIAIGTVGAISFSIYIKKTFNYKKTIVVVPMGSAFMLILLCSWLNTANQKIITSIIIAAMGFVITPIVPICYDLGCQLTFPMGEAQVTGFLNSGALLWAFLSSSFVTAVFGYGSQSSSMVIMGLLSIFVVISAGLFYFVKVDLKRRNYQLQQKQSTTGKDLIEMNKIEGETASERSPTTDINSQPKERKYQELIEEKEAAENKVIFEGL